MKRGLKEWESDIKVRQIVDKVRNSQDEPGGGEGVRVRYWIMRWISILDYIKIIYEYIP